jgi:hypothetical protein
LKTMSDVDVFQEYAASKVWFILAASLSPGVEC